MKKIIISALTSLIFLAAAKLNSQTKSTEPVKNSLQKGSWSVQFELGTYINTTTFEAFLISVKHHFTQKSSFRLGIGYNNSNSSGEDNYNSIAYPSDNKNLTLNVISNFLFYPNPDSPINLYFGIGPIYKYNQQNGTDNNVFFQSNGTYANVIKNDSKSWAAGLNGVFGAEWFVIKSISIVGEYNANIMWGKTNSNKVSVNSNPVTPPITTNYSNESTTSQTNLNIVRLGVSVYF